MKKIDYIYFVLPVILAVFQALYTFNSLNQIRYEELAESVRNPFWFQNRLIYDGISSNIGWYSLVATVYNLFGFHLFTGKIIRLILQLISFFALSFILKKYLGTKLAIVPLVTIGLSPTLLYFNTLQTSYGMDLQYLPIVLYFIFRVAPLGWGIAMFAWMSYPTFVYYLPAILYFYIRKLLSGKDRKNKSEIFKNLILSLLAFLAPLLIGILYIKNRASLIYESGSGYGIFRGGGILGFNWKEFANNLYLNLVNLLKSSYEYNFELTKVELSDLYPLLSILAVIFGVYSLWRKKKTFHTPIILILSVVILNILVSSLSLDPTPGLRRSTGVLAGFYGFFILVWYWANKLPKKLKIGRIIFTFALLILTFHHLTAYPINFSHIKDRSLYREEIWTSLEDSPVKFLDQLVFQAQKQDVALACRDEKGNYTECRYTELYSAIAASCLWNKLECKKVLGYDPKTKGFIQLSVVKLNN